MAARRDRYQRDAWPYLQGSNMWSKCRTARLGSVYHGRCVSVGGAAAARSLWT